MRKDALAILAGIIVVEFAPRLPAVGGLWLVASALVVCGAWRTRLRWVALALCAAAFAAWRAGSALEHRLPTMAEPLTVNAEVLVDSLVEHRGLVTVFDTRVIVSEPEAGVRRVRVSWFNCQQPVAAGERWRMSLRLKTPRATRNPGVADQQLMWLRDGIDALGSVRGDDALRLAAPRMGQVILRARAYLTTRIEAWLGSSPSAGVIVGLAVGDSSAVPESLWAMFRALGITHLMAISGSHVGLFGVLAAALARWLWALTLTRSQVSATAFCSIFAAAACFLYALLAGFSVPTQRTALMVAVVCLARLSGRAARSADALAFALIAVLCLDPSAVLQPGFWLSFVTVAWIFALTSGAVRRARWRQEIMLQAGVSTVLLPMTCALFGQVSLLGPLVNLVAIPFFGLLLVPAILLAAALVPVWPAAAELAFRGLAAGLDALWPKLIWLAASPMAVWHTPELPWAIIAIATIGALVAGLVPHIGWRLVGLLGTCLVFFWQAPRLRSGDFDLTVLDVGQGLAVVLLTRNYAMVYDTGPKFPSGRDMGAAVLVPYLHSRGVRRVDLLVLSHTDIDHAGGAAALGAAFPITQRLVGTSTPACVAGQTFHWDGVAIEVLGPIDSHTQGNDGSCVLSVRSGAGSVLLPGDISRRAERQLAAAGHLPQSDVAIVPHHGSRGSSSPEFIAAVKPRWALVSAGHLNRFGFPKAEVVAHWEQNGAIVRSTAVDGALTFHARAAAEEEPIDAERSVHRHYFSVD